MRGGTHRAESFIDSADRLAGAGRLEEAVVAYEKGAGETPELSLCLRLARCYEQLGDRRQALCWALRVADSASDFTAWQAAAAIARRTADAGETPRRTARLALLGSYTTSQLATCSGSPRSASESRSSSTRARTASTGRRSSIPRARCTSSHPTSSCWRCTRASSLCPVTAPLPKPTSPRRSSAGSRCGARSAAGRNATVVQHLFALPPEAPFGHLGSTLPGSRYVASQAVNAQLAASAPDHVAMVDCERLAALVGKRRWFDARYWHLAKQAVALGRAAAARTAHGSRDRRPARAGQEVPRARPRQHALGRHHRRGWPERHQASAAPPKERRSRRSRSRSWR